MNYAGVFEKGYWDVLVEYAKESPNSMLVRATITNRGAQKADLHVIPTVWYDCYLVLIRYIHDILN